jgi:hypothetical protein
VPPFFAIGLVPFEVVDGGPNRIADALLRTDRVNGMPHHEERLERDHYFVILNIIANQHKDFLGSHAEYPVIVRLAIKRTITKDSILSRWDADRESLNQWNMLKANKISDQRLRQDNRFEVTASGTVIGTINDRDATFELNQQTFSITRSGLFAPQLSLKSEDSLIAIANQKAFRNYYTLVFGGKEWTFKAMVLLATKFGLFENENQKGSVSAGPYLNRLREITADLPEELPREIQMVLLLLFIRQLTAQAN